jgi:hypothetical protein
MDIFANFPKQGTPFQYRFLKLTYFGFNYSAVYSTFNYFKWMSFITLE